MARWTVFKKTLRIYQFFFFATWFFFSLCLLKTCGQSRLDWFSRQSFCMVWMASIACFQIPIKLHIYSSRTPSPSPIKVKSIQHLKLLWCCSLQLWFQADFILHRLPRWELIEIIVCLFVCFSFFLFCKNLFTKKKKHGSKIKYTYCKLRWINYLAQIKTDTSLFKSF